jgi:LemA protein
MGARNTLVTERESVNGAWSQVDVALQRRADLIPNLVETVKGFAKQEQAVIKEVTDARAALGGARSPQERIAANGQLDSALSRLLIVVENYPQLRFPNNIAASMFSFQRNDAYFKTEPGARVAPKVAF